MADASVTSNADIANYVNIASLAVAIIYGIARSKKLKQRLISKATGLTIANGISLFPLVLLVASTAWPTALTALLESNKVILSIAGIVALLSILEDFAKPEHAGPPR